MDKIVKCNDCTWEGKEISLIEKHNELDESLFFCPKCNSDKIIESDWIDVYVVRKTLISKGLIQSDCGDFYDIALSNGFVFNEDFAMWKKPNK